MGGWHAPKEMIAVMVARSKWTPLDTGVDSWCSIASGRASSESIVRIDSISPTAGSNHEDEKSGFECAVPWSMW